MRVLVAQGVGDHERIEAVVLDCRDLVTLPGAGRDPRRHREHRVSYSLQMLDEQTFGSLDRDRQPVTEAAQPAIELGQAGDIVSYPRLQQPRAMTIDDTELMMLPAPID